MGGRKSAVRGGLRRGTAAGRNLDAAGGFGLGGCVDVRGVG